MFSGISWTMYFLIILIFLLIWYLFVGLRFYSNELNGLLKSKGQTATVMKKSEKAFADTSANSLEKKTKIQDREDEAFLSEAPDDTFKEVESMVEKLKEAIADASHKKYIRQELLQYLRLIIKEFPGLKYSPYQSAINELILSECEKQGAVTLSDEEAEMLWKG